MSTRRSAVSSGRPPSMQEVRQVLSSAVARRVFRLGVITTVLAVVAGIYVILGLMMPRQYHFVIADSVSRVWPFGHAATIQTLYALMVIWALRAEGLLTWFLAALAAAPLVALLVTGTVVSGFSPVVVGTAALAASVLLPAVHYLRADLWWQRVPSMMRSIRFAVVAGALVYVGMATASGLEPIDFPRAVGSLVILAVFVGFVAILACSAVLRPALGFLVVLYCAVAVLIFGPNDHRIPAVEARISEPDLRSSFGEWLHSRQDLGVYRAAGLPYPVILVSSEGGGIYAAAHAYGALSTLSAHCPTFSQHVFAIIGVSGGALGNALFAASADPSQKSGGACASRGGRVAAGPVGMDHLSPVMARFLLIEPIDRLLPGRWMDRDRAQILADSFLSSARDEAYLRRAIGDSFDPGGARPAVISVGVDVGNGRRFVMSPFSLQEYSATARWWPGHNPFTDEESSGSQISLINAAGVSARFPWITPTGRVQVTPDRELIVADGGYFDNSGADTVLDMINALRMNENWRSFGVAVGAEEPERTRDGDCVSPTIRLVINFHEVAPWAPCEVPVFLIHLALASREGAEVRRQSQSFVLDPVRALLATRTSRADIALQRADLDRCGTAISGSECLAEPGSSMGFFRNDIAPHEISLPLGWYMSARGFDLMLGRAVPQSIFDYRARREEAGSDLELLIFHLDPELYREGASPGLSDLMPGP